MSRCSRLVVVLAVCVSPVTATSQDIQPAYKRSIEIAPVSMTQDDLCEVIARIRTLVVSANVSVSPENLRTDMLQLGTATASMTVNLKGVLTCPIREFQRAPEKSTTVSYLFNARQDAPVSAIEMWLFDSSRRLEASGTSAEQVDAVVSAAQGALEEHTTSFGGVGFRFLGVGLCMLILAVGSTVLVAQPSMLARTAGVLVVPTVFAIIFLPPWSEWLAGTAVYSTSASSMVRYAPEISLLGAVISATGLAVTVFFSLRQSAKS